MGRSRPVIQIGSGRSSALTLDALLKWPVHSVNRTLALQAFVRQLSVWSRPCLVKGSSEAGTARKRALGFGVSLVTHVEICLGVINQISSRIPFLRHTLRQQQLLLVQLLMQ